MLEEFSAHTGAIQHCANAAVDRAPSYPGPLKDVLSVESSRPAREEITAWQDYRETPLVSLPGLADTLGLGSIHYKDEGNRFGLGSFKALGGAYEVMSVLVEQVSARLGQPVSAADIRQGRYKDLAAEVTVATATDGNHGRSVAWGAQRFGCQCRIYIHAEVSEGRKAAMEAFGATVVRISGNYDESVQQAADDAVANGWFVVSDTSYEGYTELPKQVMAGYSVMAEECLAQMPNGAAPTHIFVQGGVGGLAAAMCGYFWDRLGAERPRFVVVEPDLADCLLQSAINGRPTLVEIEEETVMAGLSCGEVSMLGWQVLSKGTDDFLSIPDALVAPAMRLLARSPYGDPPVVAGESAVAGLAALIALKADDGTAIDLGLDASSRVLLMGTEGATDPEIYQEIVGASPVEILA